MFQNMVILLFQHMLNKASRIQGVIHLVRKKNFPKNEYFLPFDTRMYVWVSWGKKC